MEKPVRYDPVLPWSKSLCGRKCELVTEFGKPARDFAERMKATMFYLNGQGLAAPQIGVFKQAAIIYYDDKVFPIFNPQIVEQSGNAVGWESCLSLPGSSSKYHLLHNQARVTRSTEISVHYQDVDGNEVLKTFQDHPARVFLHEFDHIQGLFFIDRVSSLFRDIVLRNYQNWREGIERGITA